MYKHETILTFQELQIKIKYWEIFEFIQTEVFTYANNFKNTILEINWVGLHYLVFDGVVNTEILIVLTHSVTVVTVLDQHPKFNFKKGLSKKNFLWASWVGKPSEYLISCSSTRREQELQQSHLRNRNGFLCL